jgi:flagellar protein FliJ
VEVSGPSFRFRLERVRALRERRETLAKQDLAGAISRMTATEQDLSRAEETLEHARAQQRELASPLASVAGGDLLARQAFLERVEGQRRARASELSQREAEVLQRGAELTVAAGEHEMLNRLKERRRGEHSREADRRERNILDEIATVRFGRSPA